MTASRTTTSGRGLRPTLLVAGFILCSSVWAFAELTDVLSMRALDAAAEEALKRTPRDWRPPIHRCPKDQAELWECIRLAMYRRDL